MKWNDLTMSQRAEVIQMAVKNGMRDLNQIRSFYDGSIVPKRESKDNIFKESNIYQSGGGLKGGKKSGDKVASEQCATWSNGLLRDNGYLISGNAWGLNHVNTIFNGFKGLTKPDKYNKEEVERYNHNAAGNIFNNFDSKTLDKSKPYVVNMYYNGSPAQEEAYNNGKEVTGTHTGILTNDGKQWNVTHNIHGTIHEEPFISLQRGDNKYGVTAVYEPRKDNIINRIKGFFGFADGGLLLNNKSAKGENINPYTVRAVVDALYVSNPREEFLGEPSHHYDFTQSEEWADAHGYYPDARGHRDDRVKKPAHPSHPSRGTWNGNVFELTDFGIQNPNYTLFGLNDGGQDPQAILTYQGGVVLPEITVTPKENYIFNPYDNIILHHKSRGGKIHIKSENRGKFTALKKRTGHSASWFKAHGTTTQKKMAIFALNAAKWNH